jgi:hypothetical protein
LTGLAVRLVDFFDQDMAAAILRFYWFRLADVAVPMGVALVAMRWVARNHVRWAGVVLVVLAVFHLSDCAMLRWFGNPPFAERVPSVAAWQAGFRWMTGRADHDIFPRQPRADRLPDYPRWRLACEWIDQSGQIPADARFLTPRLAQTFKWYAHRGEVANWKEIPQDAKGLVRWWAQIQDIYATNDPRPGEAHYFDFPGQLGVERLKRLAVRYEADYAITPVTDSPLPLPVVYSNPSYVIYRLR